MQNTSWDNVAPWYDRYLEGGGDTYQAQVIAPNSIRMLAITKGARVLDLACGQGYFARLVQAQGASVVGVDISKELIARAREKSTDISYMVAPAHETGLPHHSFDLVYTILAFENIKHIDKTMAEIARVLKREGKFLLVLLHPAFRIPQHSDWKFDSAKNLQYRRVDKYLSEMSIAIEQAPFKGKKSVTTTTYHRSLQWYMKVFKKHGFVISGMEEWISHKKSKPGPRQHAEDTARKEFPMFLALELQKGALF